MTLMFFDPDDQEMFDQLACCPAEALAVLLIVFTNVQGHAASRGGDAFLLDAMRGVWSIVTPEGHAVAKPLMRRIASIQGHDPQPGDPEFF